MTIRTRPSRPARPSRRGFTLTELMISLALVLLLTLAMTRIFGVTTRAISKGNAIGEVTRGLDAVRTTLAADMTGADYGVGYDPASDAQGILPLNKQPAIIIYSTSAPTFLNAADQKSDSDGNPLTIDRDNDGMDEATPVFSQYQVGRRFFRTDTLSFFAAGQYKAQASLNPGAFISDVTSNSAWIWYGHGRVYDGSGGVNKSAAYLRPGQGTVATNPRNFYASDFILVRNSLLLKAPSDHDGDATTAATVVSENNTPVLFARARWDVEQPTAPANLYSGSTRKYPDLGPLMYDSSDGNDSPISIFAKGATGSKPGDKDHKVATDDPLNPYVNQGTGVPATAARYTVQQSRVDVAGVDAAAFRERLRAVQSIDSTLVATGATNGPLRFNSGGNSTPATWYDTLFARSGNRTNQFRFWINPFLIRPLDAGETSQATSPLLTGATQFIVEFAGDFVTQNAAGATTDNQPDGVIDFNISAGSVRSTRWYGMPRDVDGDGIIPGPGTGNTSAPFLNSPDTRPLGDFLIAGGVGGRGMSVDTGMPFEKRLPGTYTSGNPETLGSRGGITDYVAAGRATDFDCSYLVAFGPGDFDGDLYPTATQTAALTGIPLRPSLIRVITVAVDRQAKLEEPLSQELIFRVPAE